jgi:galactokinase
MRKRYRAPGRINLIGEHTDYNLGYVLPMAIDRDCVVTAERRSDGRLRFRSRQCAGEWEMAVEELRDAASRGEWTDYAVGVARELARAGIALEGMEFEIDSAVPVGSGLSSSASLLVASALAMLDGREMEGLTLAKLCQRAEREFVGLPCGIMDYAISLFAEEGSALLIDCRSLEGRAVTLPEEAVVVAVNTMVKHELAESAYGERVSECQAAAREAGVESLRDAAFDAVSHLPRGRHVVTENERVLAFADAAERKDLDEMGRLMGESHESLRRDYEVSCAELDALVEMACELPGVYGARMTGGGFGGCTVNLVSRVMADQFAHAIRRQYQAKFGIEAAVFVCQPAPGASAL